MTTPSKSAAGGATGGAAEGVTNVVGVGAEAGATAAASPTQLHAALSNTLRSLDNKLVTMGQEAQTLYQQQQQQRKILLPKLEQQMDAFMLEHQMQKQLLVNIKSEYDAATSPASTPVSVITKQTTDNVQ